MTGVVLTGLGGCGSADDTGSFRFRMTVELQGPHGPIASSTVMEIDAHASSNFGLQTSGKYSLGIGRGQAAIVDLPDGPVFVLLKLPDGSKDFDEVIVDALAHDPHLANDGLMAFTHRMADGDTHAGELPRRAWPMMVRFRDIRDPKSVERVDPDAIGVRRIAIETTRDPVTTGIEKRLPSYGPNSGFAAWFATLAMDNPRRLTLDDFRKGK